MAPIGAEGQVGLNEISRDASDLLGAVVVLGMLHTLRRTLSQVDQKPAIRYLHPCMRYTCSSHRAPAGPRTGQRSA